MSGEPWFNGRRPTLHPSPAAGAFLDELDAPAWMAEGLCAQTDPEAFFPEKGGSVREAKAICRACDVRENCLAYALEHQERFGIWGGYSERERRRLAKHGEETGRPCRRPGCTETIPITASRSRIYHDADCARIANEDRALEVIDREAVVTAYLEERISMARLAGRHKVSSNVIARVLDAAGIVRKHGGWRGGRVQPRESA